VAVAVAVVGAVAAAAIPATGTFGVMAGTVAVTAHLTTSVRNQAQSSGVKWETMDTIFRLI
jgi:hypothetical protein